MGNFKVGDVCEIVAPSQPRYHGRECTVVEIAEWMDDVFEMDTGEDSPPGMYYTIDIPGDGVAYAQGSELRLKRPPNKDEFTSGDWELCPWSPYRVGETHDS